MSRRLVTLSIISAGLLASLPSSAENGTRATWRGAPTWSRAAGPKNPEHAYVRMILDKMDESGTISKKLPLGVLKFNGTFFRGGITLRKPPSKWGKLTGGKLERLTPKMAEKRLIKGKPVIFEKNARKNVIEHYGDTEHFEAHEYKGTMGSTVVTNFKEAIGFWKKEAKPHLIKYTTGPARKELKEILDRPITDPRYTTPSMSEDNWQP